MQNILEIFDRFSGIGTVDLCFAAGVALFCGALRGLTGFGFAIAAVPLLSLVLSPKLAVGVSTLLQLVFVFTDAPRAWARSHLAPFPALVTGALLGTPLGMLALRVMPQSLDRIAIALAAIVAFFVVWRAKASRNAWVTSNPGPIGFLSGLLNGLASMPGPPVVMYFLSASISAVEARASLIVFCAATAIFATVSGIVMGIVNASAGAIAAMCLPMLLAGNLAGSALFHASDARVYRSAGLVVLAAGAVSAAWKGLAGVL
jgi:uncharacterized membrane protein YfcA